jgi:hypothetical protein
MWLAVCDKCGEVGTRVSELGTLPFGWVKVHIEYFPDGPTMTDLRLFCPRCLPDMPWVRPAGAE